MGANITPKTKTKPKKPKHLLKAEAEEARLQQRQAELMKALDAGTLSQEEYDRRHFVVLKRQVVVEVIVKAFRVRWETLGR